MITTVMLLAIGTCLTAKVLRKSEAFVTEALTEAQKAEERIQDEVPEYDAAVTEEAVVEHHEVEVCV